MTTFLIISGIVIAIIFILNMIKVKDKKPKSLFSEIQKDPEFNKLNDLFEAMKTLNTEGLEVDVLPDGYGEFGHDITNPIPTNTPMGSLAYMGALKTLDGYKVQYERLGSTTAPNLDYPVNIYEVFKNGEKIATLYLTTRNNKNSEKAPKGFKLSAISGI